jgi:integrase
MTKHRKKIGIRDLQALAPGQELWDSVIVGFGARKRTVESVVFFVRYRAPDGRQPRYKIGKLGVMTPDQARMEAAKILRAVASGDDPAKHRQDMRRAATVNELLDMYLADAEAGHVLGRGGKPKKAATIAVDKGMIEGHIRPLLGSRTLNSIIKRDIERLLRDIADGKTASTRKTRPRGLSRVRGGRGAATRVVGLLGGIMSHALSHGMIESNPVSRVRRYADGRRERRLADDEYRMIGVGLKAAEGSVWPPAITCMRFLMLTGWRVGEALSLRWRDLDLARRVAILPDTKSGRSARPLSHAACDVLRGMDRGNEDELVFPATRGDVIMSGFKRHARRIVAMSGLSKDVTPHVFRHSFASLANDLGYSDATVGSLIGHRQRSITSRYMHGADNVLLAAADAVARRTAELMGETQSSAPVVELRHKQSPITALG